MSVQDYLTKTITEGLRNVGVSADVNVLPDSIQIRIKSDEVKEKILSGFPENVRKFVTVESGDIVIKISIGVVASPLSAVR